MPNPPQYKSVLDVKYGVDPGLDALLLHFMTENNLEYTIDPQKNATPEQIRFIVASVNGTFYAPCSDWMFFQLLKSGLPRQLLDEYLGQWKGLVGLVRAFVPDPYLRRRIIYLCRYKFQLALASPILIPSRLLKKMMTIFMTQSGLDDPYRERRRLLNRKAGDFIAGSFFDRAINACPVSSLECGRMDELRSEMDLLQVRRLMSLATMPELWDLDAPSPAEAEIERGLAAQSLEFGPVREALGPKSGLLKILYLPHRSGGIMFDLEIIKVLLRQGHSVILVLKEGFYFDSQTIWDVEHDPLLAEALKEARFINELRISKNELLRTMREKRFVVISDGTRERINLFRTSVTFARAWKESDLIIVKGEAHYRRFIQTSHVFTRDVLCFFRDVRGHLHIHFKPKAEWSRKFGEEYILVKAERIISEMRRARAAGKRVMFYSGIIGSIPGQVDLAIDIMNAFIKYLRSRLEGVYIINPAEHFEEGMDADDLMFMWERVQRSGFLDIWRFQSVTDIEKSFEVLGRMVPPIWAGKDATYSTGCTKEMNIALDVQRRQPELQIIGPNPEKFFRRREYGVGKFCDVAIDECT
ncbi:MAG: DUF89 family protein [Desulfovibrionaceae bacterium]|nr:DUF89 family protein [Desulfovibrionaceae bacterium]